jgi:hypothetical protein
VQSVARKDDHVPGDQLDDERVHFDALVDSDGSGDCVLLLDFLYLLPRELSALDKLVVDRVVLGHLLHAAGPREVDAAVANVRDEPLAADDE